MTEEQLPPTEPASDMPPADEGLSPDGHSTSQGREWLVQLQQMIDQVAAHAAPVARDVAAKAAELAAVAGEKAGPFAKRAAEKTEEVGARVADRSRRLADELRHRVDADAPGASAEGSDPLADTTAPGDGESTGA